MRKWMIVAIAILSQNAGGSTVQAADPWPPGPPLVQIGPSSNDSEHVAGCRCMGCRARHCFAHMHSHAEGKDLGFSCRDQGSYKFPVPPLYTYHWPGMYSAPLMTDYHSPWRFPPLKPYTEESKTQSSRTTGNAARLQPPSY